MAQPSSFSSAQAPSLTWSGATDKGRFRENNEDTFLALTFDAREVRLLGKIGSASLANADFVFAVSDGMGGARSGEFASKIATDRITRLLPKSFKQSASGLATGPEDILLELVSAIHSDMTRLGQCYDECRGMGATLTLCWFTPHTMHFAHVGDSRLYCLPACGSGLKQITQDDSYVGHLRRSGQINEREARQHPRKSILTKALGASIRSVEPQLGSVLYEPGDRFLICSDGVIDGHWDHAIADLLKAKASASHFVQTAIADGSRDNTTAIVIEVQESGHASEPA